MCGGLFNQYRRNHYNMTTPSIQGLLAELAGTEPELAVYIELVRRGFTEGVDFDFQSSLFGGRLFRGGLVVDFIFSNPPDLAISVAGEYWHFGRGVEVRAKDLLARASLTAEGITLIFIEETHALENAEFYVGEALRYIDLSRLGR